MSLCLSCSSPIPTSTPTPFLTPCCSSPICAPCLRSNPRLRTYIPCLRCGDGVKAITSASARKRGVPSRSVAGRVETGMGAYGGTFSESEFGMAGDADGPDELDDRFSLGEVEDEGSDDAVEQDLDAAGGRRWGSTPSSPPPGYSTLNSDLSQSKPDSLRDIRDQSSVRSARSIHSAHSRTPSVHSAASRKTFTHPQPAIPAKQEEPPAKGAERLKHVVRRGENVRGIATRYAMDPYDLLEYNDLPHTCLSTNPGLIQTRRHLFLQPLRSSTPAKPIASNLDSSADDVDEQTWEPTEEEIRAEKKRKEEKRLKRFQLVTKEVDRGVARTYLALEALDSQAQSSSSGSGEVLFDSGMEGPDGELPKYKDTQAGHNLDEKNEKEQSGPSNDKRAKGEAAVNHFFDDEAWEASQAGERSTASHGSRASGSGTGTGGWLGFGTLKGKSSGGTKFKTGERVMGAPFLAPRGRSSVAVGGEKA